MGGHNSLAVPPQAVKPTYVIITNRSSIGQVVASKGTAQRARHDPFLVDPIDSAARQKLLSMPNLGVHVGAQDRVDAGLVAAVRMEPVKKIGIQAHGYDFL